ncbi:HAD family hydrolase [Halorussus salinus]|uniref:HAD family hydrolase n=1 Tax=Halorussus salinus TaxID=1364935 RepID=UPI00109240B1|nr:HAD family hydrolase [Halorussus salinus]
MYDSVVFDVDGVLLRRHADHPDVYGEAVAETFRAFDADPTPEERDAFFGTAAVPEMRAVCERHGVAFEEFWPERERRVSKLQQGMMERGERDLYDDCSVLPALAKGHDLGIVSNNQHETIAFMVEEFDLGDHFGAVYGRDPTVEGFRRMKPETHYLERALDDLGTRSALYVGDSAADVLAASEAGLDSAFVRRPHRDGYSLPEEPTYEIDRLTELRSLVAGEQ